MNVLYKKKLANFVFCLTFANIFVSLPKKIVTNGQYFYKMFFLFVCSVTKTFPQLFLIQCYIPSVFSLFCNIFQLITA
jgi:hypothetical protein